METSRQDEIKITPKLKRAIIEIVDERLKETQIIRKDLSELKDIVKELAEAQKRTEQRVEQLVEAQKRTEQRVEELAEAQKKSEERFTRVEGAIEKLAEAQKRTEQRVEELAEAQKKSEERLTRVEGAIEKLAEAQKRTEQRVEELAEAQKKTEERLTRVEGAIEKLAEAQKRTEEELKNLISEHRETRIQLGGLATTVGYRLEDEAYKALPELLKRDYGIAIQERLKRQFIKDKAGSPLEVNIFGVALRNGKKITIIGEAKSQLSKNGVDEFIKKKMNRIEGLFEDLFPVLVTYMVSEPDVEEYARQKGIILYYSYDF